MVLKGTLSLPTQELHRWGERLHPDDFGLVTKDWTVSLTTGADFAGCYRVRQLDGSWLRVRADAWARRDKKGQILSWLGSFVLENSPRIG